MRNRIFAAVAAVMAATAAFAQERLPERAPVRDTVIVTVHDTVLVEKKANDKGRVHLDFDVPFYRKVSASHRYNNAPNVGNVGVGLVGATSKAPFDFSIQNSLEFWGYAMEEARGRVGTLNYGVGVTFRNLAMTGNTAMRLSDDGGIVTGPFPAGASPIVSKLRVFSISVPILYSYGFGRGYGVTLGPVVNFNVNSSIVDKYRIDGEKMKDKYKRAHANLVSADLMAQLNFKYFSVYAKYSPMNLMDKEYWPGFQVWTVGICPSF